MQQWTRVLTANLKQLSSNQTGLGTETRELAKELNSTPVFRKLVEKAAESMQEAGDRFDEIVMLKPEGKQLPDAEAAKHQSDALRRLVQVMNAIKDEMNQMQPPEGGGGAGGEQQPGDGGDEGGGGGGGQQDNGLPPKAQIKLLRDLQAEVKQKTEEFRRDYPDLDKLDEKGKAWVDTLRRDQLDIIELFEEMRRPAGEMPGGEAEADKKPNAEGDKKP